jgi:hypothetical protein
MQFKSITAIIVLLLVVASLSVAGCTVSNNSASSTPTPAPTTEPTTDYTSYFNSQVSANATIVKPYEKSTNSRGNDVYTGVVRNKYTPSSTWTLTHELAKSEGDAKAAVDATIAQKINAGFTLKPEETAALKTQMAGTVGVWEGVNSAGEIFLVYYEYASDLWWVELQQSHASAA